MNACRGTRYTQKTHLRRSSALKRIFYPLRVELAVRNAFGGSTGYRKIEQMIKVLRFQDTENQQPTMGEFKNDGIHLVRGIFDALLEQCETIIIAGERVSYL